MRKLPLPVAIVAVVAIGLATASPARAQSPMRRTVFLPSLASQSINPNPVIAPGLTLQQSAYNTAVMGRALSTLPPYALGYNPYPAVVNYGPVYPTYPNPYAGAYVNPYLSTLSYYNSLNPSASPYFP
jgi:hypothetical protein